MYNLGLVILVLKINDNNVIAVFVVKTYIVCKYEQLKADLVNFLGLRTAWM